MVESRRLIFNEKTKCFYGADHAPWVFVANRVKDVFFCEEDGHSLETSITLYTRLFIKADFYVQLSAASVSKREIVQRIERMDLPDAPYFSEPKVSNILRLSDQVVLVKGTYSYGGDYPYFGIFSTKEDKGQIEDNHALFRVIMINGDYYFITHFHKPESCAEGLIIFRLDGAVLKNAYVYYEDQHWMKKHD